MRALTLISLVLAVSGLLAGCGDDSDDNGEPTRTVVAVSPTGAASTPAAVATTGDGDDDTRPPLLPAGRLTSQTFKPAVSLTLGENWWLEEDAADIFVVGHETDHRAPGGYIVVMRVRQVRNVQNFSTPEPPPDDIIAWLTAHRDIITVEPPSDTTVAGIPARKLEVRVDTGQDVALFDDFEAHFRDRFRVMQIEVAGEPARDRRRLPPHRLRGIRATDGRGAGDDDVRVSATASPADRCTPPRTPNPARSSAGPGRRRPSAYRWRR